MAVPWLLADSVSSGYIMFFDFFIPILSTSSCYFHPAYFFWVEYVVLSVSVATCTGYRMYLIRTRADLLFLCFCLEG